MKNSGCASFPSLHLPHGSSSDTSYNNAPRSEGVTDFTYTEPSRVSVFDAAEYLLQKMGTMTTMKLHKLLYYAQAWSLVWDENILFPERIEAWANGPVIPALYSNHRGMYEISGTRIGNPQKLSEEQKETLDVIIKDYGVMHSQRLSDLTHMELPWRDARKGIPAGERSRETTSSHTN